MFIWGLLLIIFWGLIVGSFLTAFVDRLRFKKNFISQRSECNHCQKKLSVLDLIPLFSWLLLRGRCRHCRCKIGGYYPLVEIFSLVVHVLFYVFWWRTYTLDGLDLALFFVWLFVLIWLLALVIFDFKYWLLPNKIVYPLFGFGFILLGTRMFDDSSWTLVLQAFLGFLAGGGLFYVFFQISDRLIGGGDVKLGFLLGFLLADWRLAFFMIFAAGFLGMLTVIFLSLLKIKQMSRQQRLQFGPFLILTCLLALWFGPDFLDWYSQWAVAA